jgi:hypothetical protein
MEGNKFVPIDIDDLDLLKNDAVSWQLETEDVFQEQRDVEFYHQFFPATKGWTFPTSMDNMIRQWHSIESVWKLMTAYEESHSMRFSRVGFFRLDVRYVDSIDISNESLAVVPSLMHDTIYWSSQLNDRMFYGARDFAEVWATGRFQSVTDYLNWQQTVAPTSFISGLHSESFMNYLLREKWELPVEEHDVCFERVRASGDVLEDDCSLMGKGGKGVIVLSMHNSGDSLLAGFLVDGASFVLPGTQEVNAGQRPLKLYENDDVLQQNARWLEEQGMSWNMSFDENTRFDPSIPCISGETDCPTKHSPEYYKHLNRAAFSFTRGHEPWVMKDPRLCMTLSTWLSVLENKLAKSPAILFVFRNPLDVSLSLLKQQQDEVASLSHGLSLWLSYNKFAILNSRDLCRVVTR